MPPITAATIATIARETGRSRTDRTVAAHVLDLGADDAVKLRTTSCAEPGPQKISDAQRGQEKACKQDCLTLFTGKDMSW